MLRKPQALFHPKAPKRTSAAIGVLALVAVLVGASMWATGAWDGVDGATQPRAALADSEAARADDDVPHAAPSIAGGALVLEGDDALLERAKSEGWTGTGSVEGPIIITGLQLLAEGRNGLRLAGTTLHVVVSYCDVKGDGDGDGILIERASHVTLRGNKVSGTLAGIRLVDVTQATVESNDVADSRYGVILQSTRDSLVQGNRVAARDVGILVQSDAGGVAGESHDVRVEGNTIIGNGDTKDPSGIGMVVAGAGHVVKDNVIEGGGAPSLWVLGDAMAVSGNRVSAGRGTGIQVTDADGTLIARNVLEGNAGTGLVVRGGTGVVVRDNGFGSHPGAAFTADGTDRIKVESNRFTGNTRGIALVDVTDALVAGNEVKGGMQAIDLAGAARGRVEANLVEGASVGGVNVFHSDDVEVAKNTVRGSFIGIYVGNRSTATVLDQNLLEGNVLGVTLGSAAAGTRMVANTIVGPGSIGIDVRDAAHAVALDNRVDGYETGIHLGRGSEGAVLSGGVVRLHVFGVRIDADAVIARVENVTLLQNSVAVHSLGGSGHTLFGNDLRQNTQAILLIDAKRHTLQRNLIDDNRVGLHLVNATDNLIFDNRIANDHLPGDTDYLMESSTGNLWNVTKRPGTNVMGGPSIGGNYWSTYEGADADRDGLGDVPYAPLLVDPLGDSDLAGLQLFTGPIDLRPLLRWTGGGPEEPDPMGDLPPLPPLPPLPSLPP